MAHSQAQAKSLPARPNLSFLKKLAKQRLVLLRADQPATKLAEAHFQVARQYGFASWQKLKVAVDQLSMQNSFPSTNEIEAFSEAIRRSNVAFLRRELRRAPALANIDTGNGATALHLAAEHNHPPVIRMLLKAGAHLEAKFGRFGHTPLSWAITSRSYEAAEELLRLGARADLYSAAGMGDVGAVERFFTREGKLIAGAAQTGSSRYDASGALLPCPPATPIEIISDALYSAARNGRPNVVRALLERGPDLAFRAYMGGTALHWANFSASVQAINLLLAAGADPTSRDDVFRCTPRAFGICVAASWGITELVRQQLARDPSLVNVLDGRAAPLHEASASGHLAVVTLLLESGADPTLRNAHNETAIMSAEAKGHGDIVKLLGDRGTKILADSELHDAFLDAAVPRPDSYHKSGSLEKASALLKAHPHLSRVSIFAACVCGDVNSIRRFLAEDSSQGNASGGVRNWPALCYLTFSRFLRDETKRAAAFVKCAKLLLDAGADPNSFWPAPNDPTYHEAALYGAAGIANCAPLTKLLIDAGADVNDHESLYHASEFADNAALRVLLKAGPKNISYCLCHKMDMEDPAGVKLFIKHGADVNVLLTQGVFKGSRPLHFAIYRRRSAKVFRALLSAGADPNLADSRGITPYQLARKHGMNDVARLLKSKGADDKLDPHTAFLAALSSGDRKTANAILRRDPAIASTVTADDHKLLVDAGEAGNVKTVRLMLDLGFPVSTRGASYGGWDATALDWAAWNGHGAVVRLLLKRGADPTAKHGFGGDALGAAIHGASHAGHARGASSVKPLAAVATLKRLEKAVEYARTEPNQKVAALVEKMLNQRVSAKGKAHE